MMAAIQRRAIEGQMQKFLRASTATPEPNDNGRIIRYMFSDDSVARDNHTIATAGWQLDNYLRNPVFLWAHDASQLPIGKVVDVGVRGGKLMGDVEYLERDAYPFADTVYQMVRGGFLNATSVSWMPIEYRFSQDKGRAGGIDFLKQELLEVSQVPVPAMPSALVTARAAGIDTQPMHEWLERALDTGGLEMVSRAELQALRRSAKMPSIGKPKTRAVAGAKKRGLYDVCGLAYLVNELGYLVAESQWEENYEGDDSEVPEQLLAALKLLGAALIAMTQEEVGELLAGLVQDDVVLLADDAAQDAYIAAAATPAQRLLRSLEVISRKRSASPASNIKIVERFLRAGKVLSADNESALRSAVEQITEACGAISDLCDAAGNEPAASKDDDEAEANARRLREAQALHLWATTLPQV
jgi:hypothetical protein